MPIGTLEPRHAYRYMALLEGKHGMASARRDFEVLSHAYAKAVEWGLVRRHPLIGQVRKPRLATRECYVEDWELAEAVKVASPMLRAYIVLKLLTGLRRGDLLRLRPSNIREDRIHIQPHKTARTSGVRLIIERTQELDEAINAAKAARPKDIAPTLFCTRLGESYVQEDDAADTIASKASGSNPTLKSEVNSTIWIGSSCVSDS